MILGLKADVYVAGRDHQYHLARFRIKEKGSKNNWYRFNKYLYLAFRDGNTVREIYVCKMSN
jgi:hypothetical protein